MPLELHHHDHCQTCHDTRCNTRVASASCDVIKCELDCGARFHACKESEHRLLCGNEKVPCLNAGYGCPIEVLRSQMSHHLHICPASLVHCTMEWNRWPVCSSERQSHQPVQVLMDFNKDQLDIALALRDQRMLTKSMRASIRTRQILTNNLNRRHPAVPLAKQLTNGSSEKEFDEQQELENLLQDMHQWEKKTEKKRSRSPAGLRQSICDELYRVSQDTVQQLSNALHVMTGSSNDVAIQERPDFSLGSSKYPYIHCSHCERRKERLERLLDSHEAMKETNEGSQSETVTEVTENAEPITDQNEMASLLCEDDVHLQVISAPLEGLNVKEQSLEIPSEDAVPDSQDLQEHRNSSSSEGSLNGLPPPVLFVTPSTTGEVSSAPGRGHSKILVIEPPQMTSGSGVASTPANSFTSTMQASLSLDLSLESITRYQAKPDSMYTFLCAQVFRRDEFASHFQNVHSDIHGGLNGWLEQRCPLAPYGCTYSQRRFYPGEKSARIVHNENLESFGVRLDGNRPVRMEDFGLVDSPVEMEWVGVRSNDDDEQTMAALLNGMTHDNDDALEFDSNLFKRCEHMERSSPEVKIMHTDQANQSSVSLHATHQLGSSFQTNRENMQTCESNQNGVPKTDTNHQMHVASMLQTDTVQPEASLQNHITPLSDTKMNQTGSNVTEPDYLSQLPSELLRYLTRFLDAFSLCNLALTSKLLRQICCSILEERGMVIQQWEKQRGHWEVAYRVWHFSTAFTTVCKWGFDDFPSMAVHLGKCPYNIKLYQTEPVRVMIKPPEPVNQSADSQENDEGCKGEDHKESGEEDRKSQ